ncbi:hypothetical protein [Acinetobacter phage AB1I1M-1]
MTIELIKWLVLFSTIIIIEYTYFGWDKFPLFN